MQPTASWTFFVTTARAESKVMVSNRGLASGYRRPNSGKAPESSPVLAIRIVPLPYPPMHDAAVAKVSSE